LEEKKRGPGVRGSGNSKELSIEGSYDIQEGGGGEKSLRPGEEEAFPVGVIKLVSGVSSTQIPRKI